MIRRTLALAALSIVAGCSSKADDTKISKPPAPPSKELKEARVKDLGGVPVKLALDELDATKLPKLTITSPAFASMQPIPSTFSDYGEKSSPPLKIAGVPAGAKSIVIICDDPDAKEPKPFIHWVLYNMPATITEVRTAVPGTGQVRQLMNTKQGANSAGSIGYTGPKPPVGDPPHHYHFQIFAVDTMLQLEQAAKKDEVIAAAKGHVLAAGELVGTFEKPKPK